MKPTIHTEFEQLAAALPSEDETGQQPMDKRIVSELNRAKLLAWIFKLGWCTSRMAAALCWPAASQGWPMARRTLKTMLEEGLLIKRAISGTEVFLLAAKGARLLNEMTGSEATSGQSLALGNPIHRACSNWTLINAVNEGCEVITEHEIATDRAGVRVIDGKVPDGIILHDGGDATFLEVEHSWKARGSRETIIRFASRQLDQPVMTQITDTHSLRKVRVVSTNLDAMRHMSASFLEAYRAKQLSEAQLQFIDIGILPVSPSLVPGERIDGQLWYDVIVPYLEK
jgi:hypothetical protein